MQMPDGRTRIFIVGLVFGVLALIGFQIAKLAPSPSNPPALFSEDISDRFYTYATKVTGKQSLYVAKLQQNEVIERTSYAKALWFDLPSMILKVETPVEYNYYLNLSGGWKFSLDGDLLVVDVPELTNSTPAIDIAKIKFVVSKGSLLRNEKKALEKLQQDLPGLLVDKSIANRDLIRDQARTSAENFVRTWLSQLGGADLNQPIKIRFPQEAPKFP